MKTREKRERLLVGLYRQAKRNGFFKFFSMNDLADALGLEHASGEVFGWVKELESQGLVAGSFSLSGDVSARLTTRGSEHVEDLLEAHPNYREDAPIEPLGYQASAPIVEVAKDELSKLTEAVRGANAIEEADRLQVLTEIAVFEATLVQPVVATDLVERFVKRVLKWLTSKFAEGVVAQVAAALIVKLTPFLAG